MYYTTRIQLQYKNFLLYCSLDNTTCADRLTKLFILPPYLQNENSAYTILKNEVYELLWIA